MAEWYHGWQPLDSGAPSHASRPCETQFMFDSVFLNGTVGTGKSSVADALGELDKLAGHPYAVIDLDHIRRAWPTPKDDPFNHELELSNLGAIASNFREAGVEHFILAGVIELRSEVPRYEEALRSEGLLLCRLEASADVVEARLRTRHAQDPEGLQWHLGRADELDEILRAAALDTLVLDSTTLTTRELAALISDAAGWG